MKLKFVGPVALVLLLTACSGKPSSSDVKKSLDMELKSQCEYASALSANIINLAEMPGGEGKMFKVKFSASVNVKATGKLREDWDRKEKAEKIYAEWKEKDESLGQEYFSTVRSINNKIAARVDQRHAFMKANGRALTLEEQVAYEGEIKEMEAQIRVEDQKAVARKNELVDEYAKRAEGLLELRRSSTPKEQANSYIPPKIPSLPWSCNGSHRASMLMLIHTRSTRHPKNGEDYFSDEGAGADFEAERVMVKTENGWLFSGQL